MGVHFKREKQRNLLLGFMYRLGRLLPFRSKRKLRLYLDMAWIFSRLAHEETYLGDHRLPEKPGIGWLLDRVGPGQQVLDIGCGHGEIIGLLLDRRQCRITGVDYNPEFIRVLQERYGDRVTLVCDDVFRYLAGREAQRYDVIVLSNVLEHFDDPLAFLKGIRNAGKHLYIEVPDFESDHLNEYRRLAGTDLLYSDADHINEFDRDTLGKIIADAGWRVADSQFRFGVMQFWCVPAD